MSTVLITGGAKRIGFEIARFFASRGYNIALHCNNSVVEAKKKAEILSKEYDIDCRIYQLNLENINDIKTFFAGIVADFGSIEVLVNNASFFKESSVKDSTAESLLKNFSVHFFSPIMLAKVFAEQRIFEDASNISEHDLSNNVAKLTVKSKHDKGLIINMLDKNITRTQTKYFEYLAAKKSLADATKYLAVTLSPQIRTNAISPGFIIEEEGVVADEKYMQKKLATIPLQKQGSVADILAAVAYLLDSEYVNGQNLFVDGGAFLIT